MSEAREETSSPLGPVLKTYLRWPVTEEPPEAAPGVEPAEAADLEPAEGVK